MKTAEMKHEFKHGHGEYYFAGVSSVGFIHYKGKMERYEDLNDYLIRIIELANEESESD